MLKLAKGVLVIAQETTLRAAVARVALRLGSRVALASSEKTARQLMDKERFAAAVVAPAGLADCEPTFLDDVQGAVQKLVVLADGANDTNRLAASFPDALICAAQPLDEHSLVAFLGRPDLSQAAVAESASAPELLHFAGCTLDLIGRVFHNAERREVALTQSEFALLLAFARNPGRVLSRAHLRKAMDGGSGGDVEAYDRSIDMLIARLRRKIEPDAAEPKFIVTVSGAGYKFAPNVCRDAHPAAATSAHRIPAAREAQRAERRQLTVLACQIVGFAALAAKLDPEDLEKQIGPVFATCAAAIARFDGRTVRTLSDGMIAVFGYPKACENHAETAVRAALELVRAVRAMYAAPIGRFRARIGVATGLMVVGETAVGGELTLVGEAMNRAQHMCSAAAESVVIAPRARELIGRAFDCRQLAPLAMDERADPLPVWSVVDEHAGLPRFEALRRDGMSDFVGREADIERLSQCWSKALRGSGQVVQVTGEPGIGKSRLVVEFEERLSHTARMSEATCGDYPRDRFGMSLRSSGPPLPGEPCALSRWSGLPHRLHAPMSALIDELQRAAGYAPDDAVEKKVEKLQREFAALGTAAAEAATLVAGLFGLPCEAPPEIKQLAPQKRKERTFAALLSRIEAMTSRQPVLAVVEDIHWVDPTSLEFLALLVERAASLRLLLVLVARPEFVPPWPEHSYVTTFALPRLSRSDAALLVQQVAGGRRVSPPLEADIVARADGVPLFVEELTKSVLENSANNRGDGDGELGTLVAGAAPIPASLQGLLLSRLDRLDCGRQVAQAGGVIGREFSLELLRMIAGMDEPALAAGLDQLVSSGLVFRRGAPLQATFIFKHTLIRDAAYGMLVRERRQKLHANVAQALEGRFPEVAESQPVLLAYHHREAGNASRAVDYLLAAAECALLRSARTEALSHLSRVRELISVLPQGNARLQPELKLEITLARTLVARSGYTSPETRAAYTRARHCCEALGDQAFLPLTMHGQWVCAWVAGDHRSALDEARQLYLWGERNGEPVGLAVGQSDIGLTLTTLGQLTEARCYLDRALQINKFVLPGREPFIASDADGRISTLCFMQHCLLLLGLPDKAKTAAIEAAALKPDNLYSRALAQIRFLRMRVFGRDARAVGEGGRELLRLAEQQGYPFFVGTANIYVGWALAQRSEIAGGIKSCQKGLAQLRAIGVKCWLPFYLALLAECYERAGDGAPAAQAVAEALEAVEATGERVWHAEILRLKGRLLLHACADTAAAHKCFVEALHTARQQKAKLLELRAAVSLAHLLKHQRKFAQARDVLAPIYDSFTEGFDFIDVREARALLDDITEG